MDVRFGLKERKKKTNMNESSSIGGVRNKQMLIINFSYPRERGDCRICDEISHGERTYGVHMNKRIGSTPRRKVVERTKRRKE